MTMSLYNHTILLYYLFNDLPAAGGFFFAPLGAFCVELFWISMFVRPFVCLLVSRSDPPDPDRVITRNLRA